jgi:hypothetical protein
MEGSRRSSEARCPLDPRKSWMTSEGQEGVVLARGLEMRAESDGTDWRVDRTSEVHEERKPQ